MNLIVISLAIMGVISVVYSIVYTLVNVHTGPLWARILSITILLGGYVGVVALITLLLKIPLS